MHKSTLCLIIWVVIGMAISVIYDIGAIILYYTGSLAYALSHIYKK